MAVNSRVRREDFSPNADAFGDEFMLDLVQGQWRIYNCWSEYNSLTGGHVCKGQVVRRFDATAGINEGKIAVFKTKEEAVSYAQCWLTRTKL